MSKLGNLLIVGVQKAGTTSLHDHLSADPRICGAVPKEPSFYLHHRNSEGRRRLATGTAVLAELPYASIDEYTSTFAGKGDVPWRLDSSTSYFQSDFALAQIARLTPQARVVICLREPVARAHSAYNWAVKQGWETAPTFEAALALEATRREQGYWFSYLYTDTSRYSARVAAWRAQFADCKVVLFDDLCADPLGTTNDVLAWLGLEPLAALTATVKNPSGLDRNPITKALRRLANRDRNERGPLGQALRAMLGASTARRVKELVIDRLDQRLAPPPALADATRAQLAASFVDDIAQLEDLLDRDLSAWRRNRPSTPTDRAATVTAFE